MGGLSHQQIEKQHCAGHAEHRSHGYFKRKTDQAAAIAVISIGVIVNPFNFAWALLYLAVAS
ncbi:hypothetical protein AKG43_02935 [Neisseria sp. 74A18]|nr:hypothetical protein AKG43_02935 [Neisseria sp. 74A18]